jgi:uncharacterized membrane protein YccC
MAGGERMTSRGDPEHRKGRSRRFQFTLGTLLAVTFAASVFLAIYSRIPTWLGLCLFCVACPAIVLAIVVARVIAKMLGD